MEQVTMAKKVATGAFAALLAATLSFPSMAFALESGTVGETGIANGTENNGEGWAYDGADTISLTDYVGGAIHTVGNTIIDLEGENTVTGGIGVSNGDLTIEGDTSVPAEEKPVLNVEAPNSNNAAIISATDSNGSGVGNVTIEGATVNFEGKEDGKKEMGVVVGSQDVVIDNSYVGTKNTGEDGVNIMSMGEDTSVTITDSVVDAGYGAIGSNGYMTIDNSDVTVLADEDEEVEHLVTAVKGITLENMDNGEVKGGDNSPFYVTTGDSDGVKLKAKSTPGYYLATSKTKPVAAMPQTGDSTGAAAAVAGIAAMAALAGMGLSLRRKHGEHEV